MDFENKSTIPRMSPDIHYELRVVMCYGRCISHNVPTALVRGDDEGTCVCEGEGIQESSAPFSLFCYDSKVALKIKFLIKQNKPSDKKSMSKETRTKVTRLRRQVDEKYQT